MAAEKGSTWSTWETCFKPKTGGRPVWWAHGGIEESRYCNRVFLMPVIVTIATSWKKNDFKLVLPDWRQIIVWMHFKMLRMPASSSPKAMLLHLIDQRLKSCMLYLCWTNSYAVLIKLVWRVTLFPSLHDGFRNVGWPCFPRFVCR